MVPRVVVALAVVLLVVRGLGGRVPTGDQLDRPTVRKLALFKSVSSPEAVPGIVKQWPKTEGYPSWNRTTPPETGSCETVWGNGFSEFIAVHGTPKKSSYPSYSSSSHTPIQEEKPITWELSDPKNINEGRKDNARSTEAENVSDSSKVEVAPGWIECRRNPTLRTSICEGHGMVMHPHMVAMAMGGEEVEAVLGRTDEEEWPEIVPGSFQVMGGGRGRGEGEGEGERELVSAEMRDRLYPSAVNGKKRIAFWQHLLGGLQETPSVTCATVFPDPVLLVSRFEYVNVYHTLTDWEAALRTAKLLALPRPPGLLLLDGHAKGVLDPTWHTLFNGVHFAKHLPGPVCFHHLIMVPFGYSSPIFQTHKKWLGPLIECKAGITETERKQKLKRNAVTLWRSHVSTKERWETSRSLELTETFVRSFGIDKEGPSYRDMFDKWTVKGMRGVREMSLPLQAGSMRILFVRREYFLAHPRSKNGPVSRINEESLYEALKEWARERAGVVDFKELEEEEIRTRDPRALARAVREGERESVGGRQGGESMEEGSSRRQLLRERKEASKRVSGAGGRGEPRAYVINGNLAHMPFYEQVEMAYRVDVWLGVHGAGLTHLQFCRPGTHVIEIQAGPKDTQYELLARVRGLPYHRVVTRKEVEAWKVLDLLEKIAGNAFGRS